MWSCGFGKALKGQVDMDWEGGVFYDTYTALGVWRSCCFVAKEPQSC